MKNTADNDASKHTPASFVIASIAFSIVIVLVVGEVLLRAIPIPGIELNTTRADSLTGFGSYPGSTMTYRNARGDFVRRKINRWGYPDKDYGREKRKGCYRVGFFGDSFTEARQVPLEQTFFRLAEDSVGSDRVECLSFGVSGLGTLQSFLNCGRWARFLDLDMVVYVFYENDVGDQMRDVRREPCMPYAAIMGETLVVDTSFKRDCWAKRQRIIYRVGDYLTSRSLVFATISQRLQILLRYGVQPMPTGKDEPATAGTHAEAYGDVGPKQGTAPSTWPDSLREYAELLEATVLLKWQHSLEAERRRFVIMAVPPTLDPYDRDSWKTWLEKFCTKHGIDFIDPTDELLREQENGNEVFYDHFSKHGHVAFARSFANWFKTNAMRN